ncbi:von Willebrand factor, partial [Tanacetum coccineum]
YMFDTVKVLAVMKCGHTMHRDNGLSVLQKESEILIEDLFASMQDDPLKKSKDSMLGCLSEFTQKDTFNIIVFNRDIQICSSSLELAMDEAITRATEWMNKSLIGEGGTNLLLPLKQAFDMVGKTGESIPLIFLITDGYVEDEKDIHNIVKCQLVDGGINCPRICTFGIGFLFIHKLKKGIIDKPQLLATTKFIAHLLNQQVVHELLALELLVMLLENPNDGSVEVSVRFVDPCFKMYVPVVSMRILRKPEIDASSEELKAHQKSILLDNS